MESMLTHYMYRPPAQEGWVQAVFFTKSQKDYIHSHDPTRPWNQNEIDESVRSREVRALDSPAMIEPDESLWVDPKGELYIANTEDPLSDKNKRKIVL